MERCGDLEALKPDTHQIAHRVDPDAGVVYVDLDPVVSIHAAALLATPNVITVTADLRHPEQVLGDKQIRESLDFDRPIGIMFICVLHCCGMRKTAPARLPRGPRG